MKQELINAILSSYYWLFFAGLTVAIFSPIKLEKRSQNYFWFLLFLFFSIFIGFRHEVGGDWLHYLWSFSHVNDEFHPLKFSSLKDNYGYNLIAWFFYNNERIKIINASIQSNKGNPSTILNKQFELGCLDGSILPSYLQREGKKIMYIEDFLRGFSFTVGDSLNA